MVYSAQVSRRRIGQGTPLVSVPVGVDISPTEGDRAILILSRLTLNPSSRAVQRDIADLYDLHRTVLRGFPERLDNGQGLGPRAACGLLYRLERPPEPTAGLRLLVQSTVVPNWEALPPGYLLSAHGVGDAVMTKDIAPVYGRLEANMAFRFVLRATPSRAAPDKRPAADGRSPRVPLLTDAARLDWLRRKAERAGFEIVPAFDGAADSSVSIVGSECLTGKAQGRTITLTAVTFEGTLRVTDAQAFRRALEEGIGPAKSFGFGLLSLARRGRAVLW